MAIMLQTLDGERVGFLLFAGKGSLENGGTPRDCMFLSAPSQAELVEHDMNVFITEQRLSEFSCTLFWNGNEWEASVPINESIWVQLRCSPNNGGTWRVQRSDGAYLMGRCQLCQKKE